MTRVDPVEFINKTYKESALYEINDALVILAKSISKTQQENKELISAHFSKFVQCRTVLEDIWKDIKNKGLDKPLTKKIENLSTEVLLRYEGIIKSIKDDMLEGEYDSRKFFYKNEFSDIFNLKDELGKNLIFFEKFVYIYKSALKSFEKVKNSKFMKLKFEEVKPEINIFLENVYRVISKENISFEDACYHFDLYFSVSETKSDRKIMNTLLVIFKESIYKKRSKNIEFVNYLFVSLSKILKYVDDELKIESIIYFFECVRCTLEDTDTHFCKIIIKQIFELKDQLDLSASSKREYIEGCTILKTDVFINLIKGKSIAQSIVVYDELLDILSSDDKNSIQDILLEFVKANIESLKLEKFEYLKEEAGEIKNVRPCFGSNNSKRNKELNIFLREYRNAVVEDIGNLFKAALETDNYAFILMEATRIINDAPEYAQLILFQAKNVIIKNSVVLYFLCKTIRMESPILGKKEMEIANGLMNQFDFLLK